MRRREFCQKMLMVGGTAAAAPLLKACAPALDLPLTVLSTPTTASELLALATPRPTSATSASMIPSSTPEPTAAAIAELNESSQVLPLIEKDSGFAQVALVKSNNRMEGVQRAVSLLGLNGFRGSHVLLKPNFNSADPSPGSTHPDVLRTLVTHLYDSGAAHVTVGDRSGMGNTELVMNQLGINQLATELGFDTKVFDNLAATDWIIENDSDYHWSQGYAIPRLLIESDAYIQTCNLKTHRYGGHFTLSLKNTIGLAAKTVSNNSHDFMRELHNSPHQRLMIAETNMARKPALIVMDGVEAFVTGGPAKGKKVKSEVVLAGTDPVAIDAVGVAILRLFGTTAEVSEGPIFKQEQIARAVELGLGVDDPLKIQFLTADADSDAYVNLIKRTLLKSS